MTRTETAVGDHFTGEVRIDPLWMLNDEAIKVGNIEAAIGARSQRSRAEPGVLASQEFVLGLGLRPCCLHKDAVP